MQLNYAGLERFRFPPSALRFPPRRLLQLHLSLSRCLYTPSWLQLVSFFCLFSYGLYLSFSRAYRPPNAPWFPGPTPCRQHPTFRSDPPQHSSVAIYKSIYSSLVPYIYLHPYYIMSVQGSSLSPDPHDQNSSSRRTERGRDSVSSNDPSGAGAEGSHDKPRLTEQEKKNNHIASEQKRRAAIREGFDRLTELVPGLEGQGRSESVVLKKTVDFLRLKLQERQELVAEIERLGGRVDDAYRRG